MTSKIAAERNQKTLLELAQQPGNSERLWSEFIHILNYRLDVCADCLTRNPRWASHSLGIFICVGCASVHRKLGTHITKVKSLTLDTWSKEQVEFMKQMGNIKSNATYNPNIRRNPPPTVLTDSERDSELEKYVRAKYESKRFMERNLPQTPKEPPTPTRSRTAPPDHQLRSGISSSVQTDIPPMPSRQPVASSSSAAAKPVFPPQRGDSRMMPTQPQLAKSTFHHPTSSFQSVSQALPVPQTGVWADLASIQTTATNGPAPPLQYLSSPSAMNPYLTGAVNTGYPSSVTHQVPFAPQPMASSLSAPPPLQRSLSLPPGAETTFNTGMLSMGTSNLSPPSNNPFPMNVPPQPFTSGAYQTQPQFYQSQPQQSFSNNPYQASPGGFSPSPPFGANAPTGFQPSSSPQMFGMQNTAPMGYGQNTATSNPFTQPWAGPGAQQGGQWRAM